ncbi:ATP-binding cassette domain-containing protein [Streptosporangium sp. NBC_01755]|uniref:ATP-binding cassette domain-containing protein n=1 Tax=unclassified Streptosporangium TaxID=2632669 RepID=UPI002DD7C301|nr:MULTISPECIES: ATP-binding cassette domain-containing protein [unclassified Streptosporangium]WSA27988.1 ATP-binding cassette domain-containing protein [Streptosporangium sp. NBC_01810]WSD00541.1 ATP-binding cassette domain-containing protein [Streptosporangium sp. NBC_01755]
MDRTTPPAIRVAGLGRDFGDRSAVHQLDLQVNTGEVYGLLGPNGSGKSTTVRMLTTMLRPSRGTAHVAGADITREPETVRRRIGIVLQETALDPLMSARELLHLQGRLQSFTARQARDRGAELLASFSLEEFADTPVSRLSGGQRRRVDLAVALVQRPLVLFLDEPTTGLDPISRRRLWEEIRTLSAGHRMTVLLTTQYLEEADQLCDRVGILREGRLVTSAAPHALKAEAGDRVLTLRFRDADTTGHALRLLTDRGEQAALTGPDARALSTRLAHPGADGKILLALASAGLHADSLSVDEPSLEDVFLRLATAPKGESAA